MAKDNKGIKKLVQNFKKKIKKEFILQYILINMKKTIIVFLVLGILVIFSQEKNLTNQNLTNIIFFQEKIIPTNPLEFYEQSTKKHFIRRTEVIFFISIPFSFLFTNILYTLIPYGSFFSAYFNGVRGQQFRASNFNYNRESQPVYERVNDPFYIFIWNSSTLWPATIALNSFIERAIDPKLYQDFKRKIINNRPALQRINQNRF